MRHRDVDTAVSRLLPAVAPSAVLMTDDPAGAVGLLSRALGRPGALESAADAQRALARSALPQGHWSVVQVIGSLPPQVPADDDVALAGALRALPDPARAVAVLHLVAGLSPLGLGVAGADVEAAVDLLGVEVLARDDHLRRERARAAALFRRPGAGPERLRPAPALPDRLTLLAARRPLPDTAVETLVVAVGRHTAPVTGAAWAWPRARWRSPCCSLRSLTSRMRPSRRRR